VGSRSVRGIMEVGHVQSHRWVRRRRHLQSVRSLRLVLDECRT
jgi:hypothetical protein